MNDMISPDVLARQLRIVGTRPLRPDGADKVTGRAQFGADKHLPNMLVGKVLRSPHAHARIKSIDTSKAEGLKGVCRRQRVWTTVRDGDQRPAPDLPPSSGERPAWGRHAHRLRPDRRGSEACRRCRETRYGSHGSSPSTPRLSSHEPRARE